MKNVLLPFLWESDTSNPLNWPFANKTIKEQGFNGSISLFSWNCFCAGGAGQGLGAPRTGSLGHGMQMWGCSEAIGDGPRATASPSPPQRCPSPASTAELSAMEKGFTARSSLFDLLERNKANKVRREEACNAFA